MKLIAAMRKYLPTARSHLAGGGWIEIRSALCQLDRITSHLAEGGWIEIETGAKTSTDTHVPPRRRWVD